MTHISKTLRLATLVFGIFFASQALWAQMPSVELKDLSGKSVNSSQISNDGKPYIVTFFATWCKPCLRELKAINEVYDDWQEQTGVKLFAISIDEAQNAQRVKPLVDGMGWEYEVLLDTNSELKRAMNVDMPPMLFLFDGEGKIVYSHSGYTQGAEDALFQEILKITQTH